LGISYSVPKGRTDSTGLFWLGTFVLTLAQFDFGFLDFAHGDSSLVKAFLFQNYERFGILLNLYYLDYHLCAGCRVRI
jgi:hypothetical protein